MRRKNYGHYLLALAANDTDDWTVYRTQHTTQDVIQHVKGDSALQEFVVSYLTEHKPFVIDYTEHRIRDLKLPNDLRNDLLVYHDDRAIASQLLAGYTTKA